MINPTNENGPGNVGLFYGATVYCNSGRTGLFGTNFTLQNWLNRFADKHGVYYLHFLGRRLGISSDSTG